MKISVCLTTYNQEKYVGETIEGIMSQSVEHPFELVIGDDCSTDNTGDICRDLALKHPNVIRYSRREQNLGMMGNLITTLRECSGEYIAICEGDDYWIDREKLKKQADFLDAHPDFSFCAHNHYFLYGDRLERANEKIREDFIQLTTEDYLLDPHFQTASFFFRAACLPREYPEWYPNVLAGDHFLVLFLSLRGKLGYFNEPMSAFRVHQAGQTGSEGPLRIKVNFVEHLTKFDEYTEGRFHSEIEIVKQRWELVYKVYEPIGYFAKLKFFTKRLPFFLRNFERTGGLKLPAKYVLPRRLFNALKPSRG